MKKVKSEVSHQEKKIFTVNTVNLNSFDYDRFLEDLLIKLSPEKKHERNLKIHIK